MRVVVLDPLVTERVDARESSRLWRTALHEGGYFVEPGATVTEEARTIVSVRAELAALEAAELNIELAQHPIPWLTGSVPDSVKLGMVLVFAAAMIIGSFVDTRFPVFGLALTPLIFFILALIGLAVAARHELLRRKFLAIARLQRVAHGKQLQEAVERLACATFVLRTEGTLLVGAPHRTWLNHRLRDLRAAYAPDSPPEHRALMERLREATEAIDERLRLAATGKPPDKAALQADVPGLATLVAAIGVRRGTAGAALAAALERVPG